MESIELYEQEIVMRVRLSEFSEFTEDWSRLYHEAANFLKSIGGIIVKHEMFVAVIIMAVMVKIP